MTNVLFNEIMEATLQQSSKPTPSSTMEERFEFIRAKYVERKFTLQTCEDERDLLSDLEHAVNNKDLHQLLQVFAEGVDLASALPTSEIGETALHLAVVREMGKSLHLVDFLVQNMPTQAIDKPTLHTPDASGSGFNTALHLCAIHDKPECMKLLLRSGADITLKNSQDKTPMAIAREQGNITCENLLHYALERQKSHFENVFTEWNLLHDEASTDFSDDETIIDDRGSLQCSLCYQNGSLTPEKKSRSRPPSFVGDSPVNPRSRSSTSDSLKSGSSPNSSYRPVPPPPPPQNRKPSGMSNTKKRTAPLPPGTNNYGTLPSSHSRIPSDPIVSNNHGYHTLNHPNHKRSPSTDSGVVSTGRTTLTSIFQISGNLGTGDPVPAINPCHHQTARNPHLGQLPSVEGVGSSYECWTPHIGALIHRRSGSSPWVEIPFRAIPKLPSRDLMKMA
uniref:Uncharacterized protein n=1 Tax=Timema cristinae TaxID=61476 RepID=A0A7R9CTS3_TIMCR|nr:unnamed protein product [Timema cristinae]